jgi:hypothetical protein
MKLSNLNDYLQTLATMGAIVGLLMVGYEVRQSNYIATSQAASANWTNWVNTKNSQIDSNIARTIAKSMTRPDELSLEEKIELGFYFESWIYLYSHDAVSMFTLTNGGEGFEMTLEQMIQDIKNEVPMMFGSRFSRAWLQKNSYQIPPEIMEVIDAALEGLPIGSGLAHWQSIDDLAATME